MDRFLNRVSKKMYILIIFLNAIKINNFNIFFIWKK